MANPARFNWEWLRSNEKAVKKFLGVPKIQKIDTIISIGFAENTEIRNKIRKDILEMADFK